MLQKIIPALEWLRNYQREDLKGDLTAGLIVAIMLVPQGMAYAMLAGLPPVVGLYASTLPLIVYVLFGSSSRSRSSYLSGGVPTLMRQNWVILRERMFFEM